MDHRSTRAAVAWAAALSSLIGVWALPARAQSKVAVLGVEASRAPSKLTEQLSAALKEHVKSTAGYKLVPAKGLAELKLVFGCLNESPACMSKVGNALTAQRLIWGKLVRSRRRSTYRLSLVVFDVDKGAVEALESQTFSPATANAETVLRTLVGKILKPRVGTVVIEGGVKGADVLLGSRSMGTISGGSFMLRGVAVGTHDIKIQADGYHVWSRRVEVVAGGTINLTVKLEPVVKVKPPDDIKPPPHVAPPPPDKRPSRVGWKIAFWTGLAATLGAGAGVLVSGLKVKSLEDDKAAFIGGLPKTVSDNVAAHNLGCAYREQAPGASFGTLDQICSDGSDQATVTNIMIGVTAGVAVLTGFFAYMAFSSADESMARRPLDGDAAASPLLRRPHRTPVHVQLLPAASPNGASMGLKLTF